MSLRATPVPAVARQTMQNAFENLRRTISPQDSQDFDDTTLQRVQQEALDIENQLGSRGWLRNMRRLKPLFTALEHYSKVMDTLCNGTPFLPWIWAPITLVLRICSEHIESFDLIIGAYSRIASSLSRFGILDKAFGRDPNFSETLASYYAEIIEFHQHAYKFVRRSGWKLLFATSWGRFQRRFDNILDNMKRYEDAIDRAANAHDIAASSHMRQDLRSWREESMERIRLQDQEQSAKEFQAIQSWLRVLGSDQLTIFDSISDQGTRYPGTCEWVLRNAKVHSWLQQSPQTPILWLCGTAGTGKSVISTQLIKFIKNLPEVTMLYHFCTNASPASADYDQALKSLLEQLLRQDAELTAHVYHEYVLRKQLLTTSALEQLFQSLLVSSSGDVNQSKQVRIVLDGVDELRDHTPNSQARLLSLMKRLVSTHFVSEGVTCKILISGRPSTTLSHVLRRKPIMSLTDEKKQLEKAIQLYASQRLGSLQARFQQLGIDVEEMDDIGRQIADKSDGMFLYARLVLDYVSSNIFIRGEELKRAIHLLPKELADFYKKIVAQILAPLDDSSKEHIKCIIGWIAFARRPLRRSELLSAVSFSSGDPDIELPAPQYVLDVCRSLVEERSDTTMTFIHVSVKEFLQGPSSNLELSQQVAQQQHSIALVACLSSSLRLLGESFSETCRLLLKGVYGLQVYAAEYWTECVLTVVETEKGLDTQASLLHLLHGLIEGLNSASGSQTQEYNTAESPLDSRLAYLEDHEVIKRFICNAIAGRSLKQLEQHLKLEKATMNNSWKTTPMPNLDGISALLVQYQVLLTRIICGVEAPGISMQELEAFRNEFRTSVHTCRLRSCPHATVGFESEELRVEHELSHVRRSLYPCTDPGCQYPPFITAQALKAHTKQQHERHVPRNFIRTGTKSFGTDQAARLLNPQEIRRPDQERDGIRVSLTSRLVSTSPPDSNDIAGKRLDVHVLDGQTWTRSRRRPEAEDSREEQTWEWKTSNSEETTVVRPATVFQAGPDRDIDKIRGAGHIDETPQAQSSLEPTTGIMSLSSPHRGEIRLPAMLNSPPPPAEKHLVKVYQYCAGIDLKWQDAGIGWCEARTFRFNSSASGVVAAITVESHLGVVLNTNINKGNRPRRDGSFIEWRDSITGLSAALSFPVAEGCAAVWAIIDAVCQGRLSGIGTGDQLAASI